MNPITDALVLDLVEWIAREPRPYADVLDAWRTSCPRLMIWEEAVERGFVERRRVEREMLVSASMAGRDFLRAHGRVGMTAGR